MHLFAKCGALFITRSEACSTVSQHTDLDEENTEFLCSVLEILIGSVIFYLKNKAVLCKAIF